MNLLDNSDEELIKKILDLKTTNRRYLQEILYERYVDKIYVKCLLICKNEESAKDITQDVFILVFTKLSTFRFESPFFGWIYKIAYYESLKYLKEKNRLNWADGEIEHYADQVEEEKPDISIEAQYSSLNKAFEKLSDINRAVMTLKYKEGKSINEIAEMLEVGESAVKMRLKRSKLFIQNILNSQENE